MGENEDFLDDTLDNIDLALTGKKKRRPRDWMNWTNDDFYAKFPSSRHRASNNYNLETVVMDDDDDELRHHWRHYDGRKRSHRQEERSGYWLSKNDDKRENLRNGCHDYQPKEKKRRHATDDKESSHSRRHSASTEPTYLKPEKKQREYSPSQGTSFETLIRPAPLVVSPKMCGAAEAAMKTMKNTYNKVIFKHL